MQHTDFCGCGEKNPNNFFKMLLSGNRFTLLLLSLNVILDAGVRTCMLLFQVNTALWRCGLDVKGTDYESAREGESFG